MKPTFIPSLQLNRTCQPSSLNGHLPSFSTIFPLSEDSQFWSFLMVWVLFWLHLSLPTNPLDNSSINNGIKNHFSFQNALTGGHYNERWQIEKNGVKWNWKSKIVNRMNEFSVHGQRYSISTILCNLFNNFSDKDHFQKQRVIVQYLKWKCKDN